MSLVQEPDDSDVLDAEEVAEAADPSSKTVRSPVRLQPGGSDDLNETVAFEPASASTADEDALGHDVVVEGESKVNLGKDSSSKGERPSGVDLIAEALESGVDLTGSGKKPAPVRRTSEVDIGGPDEPEDASGSAVNLGAPSAASPSAKKEGSAPVMDEKGIEDLLMGDDEPTAQPASGTRSDKARTLGEETWLAEEAKAIHRSRRSRRRRDRDGSAEAEAAAVADEEEEVPPAKGKGKGKKDAKVRAPKPRRARYVLVGLLLGILLLGGAAAGTWFVDPAREQAFALLGLQKIPQPTPLQLAHGFMDKGDYASAVSKLEAAGQAPDVASARAQARWLKYLQDNKGKDVDENAPEVKTAQTDAKTANNEGLQKQIKMTLDAQKAKAKLDEDEKALATMQKTLVDAKLVDAKDADVKKLPEIIEQVVKNTGKAGKDLETIAKMLADAKLIDDAKDFDLKKFGELVNDFAGDRGIVAGLQTDLKAKTREEVAKAAKTLVAAQADLDAKLKDVNEKLKDAKVEGEGAVGVAKLVEARNKLEKESMDLDAVVKSAFEVLKEEKLTPPGVEPSKGLLEATKLALDKARTPLVISLGQMAAAVGGLGSEVGGIMQRSYDAAKLNAELAYYRGREPLIQTPEQKLDTWAALLQDRSHNGGADLTAASNEAQWVLADPRAGAAAKARAHYVIGLAERNRGKARRSSQGIPAGRRGARRPPRPGWGAPGPAGARRADRCGRLLPAAGAAALRGGRPPSRPCRAGHRRPGVSGGRQAAGPARPGAAGDLGPAPARRRQPTEDSPGRRSRPEGGQDAS